MKSYIHHVSPLDLTLVPTLGDDSRLKKDSILVEKTCPICNKQFYIRVGLTDDYVYVRYRGKAHAKKTYYCGWNCMCKGDKENEQKREARKNRKSVD